MTRLRSKGGASPESLWELYNGYVNASKIPQQRPSSIWKFQVPVGSKGLVFHKGVFYTFTALAVAAVAGSTNLVLRHPNGGFGGTIKQIHFAQPFMGYLYVVAEFNAFATIPSIIVHYWLQKPAKWLPNQRYNVNDMVQPAGAANGLYYVALQGKSPLPAWTPALRHKIGDGIQPTVYNGFVYYAIAINGKYAIAGAGLEAPSGLVEPTWPTELNATVLEGASGAINTNPNPAPTPPDAIPPGMRDGTGDDSRYTNPGGSGTIPWARTPVRVR